MASHDTKRGNSRAISQDNTVRIKKLNQELRKLKEHIQRKASKAKTNGNDDDNGRQAS